MSSHRHTNLLRQLAASSLLLVLTGAAAMRGQQTVPNATAPARSSDAMLWRSDQATLLVGLPDVKDRTKGSLSISTDALVFTTLVARTSIDRTTMLSVSVGDVRVETGGTAGRISRAIIPFGGGSALATVTNKQIDLLTVQFRDERNALHGAVFLLPKNEAVQAQQRLGSLIMSTHAEKPYGPCQLDSVEATNTVSLASIRTDGDPVPAEYQVLLYEQLVSRLRESAAFSGIYRDGDTSPAASCPAYTVSLVLGELRKGNAALRASTGPIGMFVGATSLRFHVVVMNRSGNVILDQDLKASKRGDSESLDVADKIAKTVSKKLKKASVKHT